MRVTSKAQCSSSQGMCRQLYPAPRSYLLAKPTPPVVRESCRKIFAVRHNPIAGDKGQHEHTLNAEPTSKKLDAAAVEGFGWLWKTKWGAPQRHRQ